ncbi:hypothetical protein Cgig2_025412 [Carnegiea gigantea]|uniref:Cation/H+ exchanger domain-containing protein n=1 Tax=Carnegiea gigantea TaxID=171969 RepID=A0A9Q1QA01_9CARY|nr:hypothetical protein Cgig2_025412 [Carnegiea gigantea]
MKNETTLCSETTKISSDGIWHENPLMASVPLLLLQLTLISLTSRAVDFALKPLGQSRIVSQILGGMVLGPSALGQAPKIAHSLFPERGTLILELLATFGIVLFLFSIGIKMDSTQLFKPERTAFAISISLYVFTMILPMFMCFYVMGNVHLERSLRRSLPIIVATQSLVAFPSIACLLAELKIFNTNVGRLAVATSMFYDLLTITTCTLGFSFIGAQEKGALVGIATLLSAIGLALSIALVIRPLMLRFLLSRKVAKISATSSALGGAYVNDNKLYCMFVLLFLSTLASELAGQHYFLGPMILGLSVPGGSSVGGAIVSKLDTFVSGLLYPTFLTICGLKTNIFKIGFQESWTTAVIVAFGVITKFAAVTVPAIHMNVPIREAIALGLVLNARGINELILYNLVSSDKNLGQLQKLSDQEFTLLVISIAIVTAIITPLVKFFYDPSRRYIPKRRMTIQHHKKDTELGIAVCIYHQDEIPTLINLLEASSASTQGPIYVIVVILVEVVGNSAPMLLDCRPQKALDVSNSRYNHVSAAFQQYEKQNEGNVSVQVFANMSRFDAMHDDVCRVAIDKRASLLIVPFHKQWAIDGRIGSVNRSIQAMNRKIIEWAPCSIGILIDRGPINNSLASILSSSRSVYRIVVLFIGGPDDMESLAYGSRMARQEQVLVTIIRFILLGHNNTRERKHETEIIEEYKKANVGNERFVYHEELVKDGVDFAETIRGIGSKQYDLILVGRNHHHSPLLFGLHAWSECPELGVIGDLLASPDAETASSVLVIQQQKIVGKVNTALALLQNDRDMLIHNDEPSVERLSGRLSTSTMAISTDRGSRR